MRISSLSSSKVTCHEMPLSNMSHLETCWGIDFFVNFCGLISLYIIPAWIAWTFRSWSLHRRGQRANHDWTPACEEENQVSCEDSYVAGFESIEGNFRRIWAVQEGLKTEDWSHSNGSNSTNQIKFNLNINSHSQLLIWHRRRIQNCGARPMVMSCCWCWSSRIVVVWHFHFQFCSQDFGSPNRNGLGHKVCKTVDPVSQKQVDAVFVPKLKKGYWQGSISNIQQLSDSTVVDDDANSLRVNQLLLARTCPSHRCNDIFFMIWDMIMNHVMNNLNNIIIILISNIINIISISVPGSLFHCTDSGTDWNWFWNCTDTDIVPAPVGYFAYDF